MFITFFCSSFFKYKREYTSFGIKYYALLSKMQFYIRRKRTKPI